jgi:HD-GYP domain-containing protein (c-di-GMP phosphodiesterase class II)
MIIERNQIIRALSDMVDLVGVDEVQHSKRVAYMALICSQSIHLPPAETTALYHMSLLHDSGVSSTQVHERLVNELEWKESQLHCQIGAERIRRFSPLASMAEVILYHHTKWEHLQRLPLSEETKRNSGLIYLLDRVDALANLQMSPNRLAGKDAVRKKIIELQPTYFKPELVEIFPAASENEAFWITMEQPHLVDFLQTHQPQADPISVNLDELKSIAVLFAQIVDAKSRYTAEHSRRVASLSRHLAERCGLSESICCKVEMAGLLHDLGKLQVPDKVLEQ